MNIVVHSSISSESNPNPNTNPNTSARNLTPSQFRHTEWRANMIWCVLYKHAMQPIFYRNPDTGMPTITCSQLSHMEWKG